VVFAYLECGAGDAESGAEYGAGEIGSGEVLEEVEDAVGRNPGKAGSGAIWLTRWAGNGGDPSLRLTNGYAQDDKDV
jgi:hypothetical protein